MKKIALLVLLVLLLLPAAALGETKLMVVSDLHYLAPSLYQGSSLFLQVLRQGDGKTPQYGEELLSALYREIQAEKPDALIITGDLTYNGEKESHLALAAWLKTVEDAGVPVWVIPGNHDINAAHPIGFSEDKYFQTDPVTPEEFAVIYGDFMNPGSVGFSYAVPVSDELLLVMTDVSQYRFQVLTAGMFTSQHALWLEEVLKQAGEAQVITATHHSLIQHTEFAKDSYLMLEHEAMQKLAARYGVHLNLSGHLHIQHIAREGDLYDAALGAFCLWPHRYAVVALSGQTLKYEAKSLSGAYLPSGFLDESREWFSSIAREKAKASEIQGTEEEKEAMADYAARFNLAYFSGTYRQDDPTWTQDPAYALWKQQPNSTFWKYMWLVMQEAGGEHLRIGL